VREYDRGDDFEGVTGAARSASWFNPRWRSVLVKWYKEVRVPLSNIPCFIYKKSGHGSK
jgi:hypothetical protein